ncbi:MAG: class I SAM-dependent methyltransferase [Burkholderiales bacterium]
MLAKCPQDGCGLIWLDPMPLAEDIGTAYAEYYTHAAPLPHHGLSALFAAARRGYLAAMWGYGSGIGPARKLLGLLPFLYPGRRTDLDFSVMWLEPRAMGRLLDIGAGGGELVGRMCDLGWRAEGLDFDVQAVRAARARGLVMHEGGLPEQRFAAESYDAVTMCHSLEHVHDPLAWLAEARRILRPGGRLAIATPNSRSLLHRRFGQYWFALDPPRHLHLFNRDALSALLRKAGFADFRVFTSVRDARGAWRGSRAIRGSGRFDMTARPGAALRIAGQAVQFLEFMVSLADADAGEDLVALAERTA